MFGPSSSEGLILPRDRVPRSAEGCVVELTEEAALAPFPGEELRVQTLVVEGDRVSQGQPLLRLRAAPDVALVAPMSGRVASIELKPGRRLDRLILFREADGRRHLFDAAGAQNDAAMLRVLMQNTGMWRALRSRPFGKVPGIEEKPAAIFVMAVDTRPGAPEPHMALDGREEDFARGLDALSYLAQDCLYLIEPSGNPYSGPTPDGLKRIRCGALHPQGLAGLQIHHHCPATLEAPVWDIHAEDVAGLGALLATGLVPETRLVSVFGPGLRETRILRCQPGANLHGLCHSVMLPGAHEVLTGSALDGAVANWLGPRDRQVTVLPKRAASAQRHWFRAALERASRRRPVIPTAALDQALGGRVPAAALIRALASGDQETANRLGVLSLVEEDLALADYVTAARPLLSLQLREILNRIEAEEGSR